MEQLRRVAFASLLALVGSALLDVAGLSTAAVVVAAASVLLFVCLLAIVATWNRELKNQLASGPALDRIAKGLDSSRGILKFSQVNIFSRLSAKNRQTAILELDELSDAEGPRLGSAWR
ncbi:MAG: hypothetical protein KC561_21375, partial [Myxococcales bacterium]|nr:hypothetical protein [Myxococcales bacterium]